ncbi:MAG: sugar phosphate isomerase/epimerase [Bacteroidales bacterium]|nr:sugar phosphate isomerase/epimerase [Bacteroidales bacterium]
MKKKISRRQMLLTSGAALLGAAALKSCTAPNEKTVAEKPDVPEKCPYRIAINAATISGYNLPIEEQIKLSSKAGYDGIELWTKDIDAYIEKGGKPADLKKLLEDNNLVFENTIGFAQWMVDDDNARKKGMEQMKREMEVTAQLGGKNIAATAMGLDKIDRSKLDIYAGRYAELLQTASSIGVRPLLEVWGAGALNQLSDAMYIATASKQPSAALLLDFYHLYRGGNSYDSLALISGSALPVFHLNDFPANPEREKLEDADRVYPGDGICPFDKVLPILAANGFKGAFSLELFNKSYWQDADPFTVLKTGYEKSRAILDKYFK